MLVEHIMSRPVEVIGQSDDLSIAARKMHDHRIGSLPVVDGRRILGIVTDRDIVLALASKRPGAMGIPVSEAMTDDIITCNADQTVEEIAGIMGDHQVRRLLVVDEMEGLVGIVTVGDIAEEASELLAGQALGEIVELR